MIEKTMSFLFGSMFLLVSIQAFCVIMMLVEAFNK
ncbi:hypothetical protein [Yersinia phage PY100]|nr:hypothetical protein X1_56 [Yersinia phage vB_Yen_X1]CAJ28399.1 hypothetical protein [Yersinia phage PY100]